MCYNLNVTKDRFKSLKPKGIDTMANTTTPKMTKAQKFAIIADLPEVKSNPMLSEFIAHEMELLSKKNSAEKKPTATQQANEVLKTAIANGMEVGVKYTITDLIKNIPECAELTTSKVSAVVRQMVDAGVVVRTEEKRKAYFSLA